MPDLCNKAQATQKKWTGKEISAVYGNAIEVSSNKSFMRGILDAFKPEVYFVHRHRQARRRHCHTFARALCRSVHARGGLELKAVARTTVRLAKARLEFELVANLRNPGEVLHLPMNVDDNTPNAQT